MKLALSILSDAMIVLGLAAVSYGAWAWSPPLGFSVAGVSLVLLGFAVARAG